MKVSVIGTGYVGLVSGVCLAEKGHDVVCVDIAPEKVQRINSGDSPIYEPGLEALLRQNLPQRLCATADLEQAVLDSDLSIICVGTPFTGERIDLSAVTEVSRQIGRALRRKQGWHLVTVKSTVVPGTTDGLVLPALEAASGKAAGRDFGVGMNPEFLREGNAIADFMTPDRIVIGSIDQRSQEKLAELYAVFPDTDKLFTSNKTAEMIKYTANSLLATLISFSNEIGNLCSCIPGVDVLDVMRGVHLDKRLNPRSADGQRTNPDFLSYLQAGCGFGGSCFPKDVKALIAHGEQLGCPMRVLKSVVEVNREQPLKLVDLLRQYFPSLDGLSVAVLGLAFKPGTDDIRESPAISFITDLLARGVRIRAYDPVAAAEAKRILGNHSITYEATLAEAIQGTAAVAILTRWDEFLTLPPLLAKLNPPPLLIDGRRMLDKEQCANYAGIGLGSLRTEG